MKTYQIKIFTSDSRYYSDPSEHLEKQFNEWCQKMKYEEGFNVWKTNFSTAVRSNDYVFFYLTALFTQNNLHQNENKI